MAAWPAIDAALPKAPGTALSPLSPRTFRGGTCTGAGAIDRTAENAMHGETCTNR